VVEVEVWIYEEEEKPSPGFKTIDEEKADLVNKLGRLEKKGVYRK